jgi:HlyD family secretion protein
VVAVLGRRLNTDVRRRVVLFGVIPLVAAGLLGAHLYGRNEARQGGFRTAKVERGSLTASVATTGTLNAVITVQVGTQVSGQIQNLFADFNSRVKKGQLIARIDPASFETRVIQARADVDVAEANVLTSRAQVERARSEVATATGTLLNQQAQVERAHADIGNARAALAAARAQTVKSQVALADAKRDQDRKNELFSKGLIPKSDRDTAQGVYDAAVAQIAANRAQEEAFASAIRSAEAQLRSSQAQEQALAAAIRSAEAQLEVTRAQLRSAEATVRQKKGALQQAVVDLDRTSIYSPVDGVVVSRSVDTGQTVAASLSSPTFFTIAQDLTKMQVDTNVDEADIGRIREGQSAIFVVDSFRGETFSGVVTQVRKAPKVVQNVVTYNVVVTFDNPDQKLLPGLTANLSITVDARPSVLKIPNAALRFRPGSEVESYSLGDPRTAPGMSTASVEKVRTQLTTELKLTEDQQKALEPLLEERRQQFMMLDRLLAPQRRPAAQRIHEEVRVKIRALLNPDQQVLYDRLPIGQPAAVDSGRRSGTAWILDAESKPRPVSLRLGLTDGSFTEILDGELKEGQEVLVSISTATASPKPSAPQSSTPRLRL